MFVHWSDYVALYWDLIFNPITLIGNLLLIVIILKNTPESTRTYAAIILLMSLSDCVGAISGVMSACRVIPMDPELLTIYRGACILFFNNDLEFKAQACQLSVDGILKICEKSSRNYPKRKQFKEAVKEVTRFYLRIENFIKTQSNKDQTAYGIHGEKKNEECRL
uniref:G_PROTEIN_RECEP_F1_2 domain-containing protein n=1 Tax=Caenorhabditis tropicalis TaxID=1561998 RepID=A0A1I7T6N8_9PELO